MAHGNFDRKLVTKIRNPIKIDFADIAFGFRRRLTIDPISDHQRLDAQT